MTLNTKRNFNGAHVPKYMIHGWKTFFVALLVALLSLQCTTNHATLKDDKPVALLFNGFWPQEKSDLQIDPNVVFGKFNNGFRYILRSNKTPVDRVSMHLYIQVGSLNETDDEQGMAHFIEHMLFKGSTHFPPGEMVKFFQRIGMQFGPDANAHTGFAQTVYDVILPKGDTKNIDEGLMVLADYAQGALMLPAEVEKERRVILSEMRSRDSAEFRALRETFKLEMPGSLIARRFPIGDEQVLKQMDAQMLSRFYYTWYRPDRMFLVVAGDFDAQSILPAIQAKFAHLQARGGSGQLPDVGEFVHQGIKSFYHYDSEIANTTVRIETVEQKTQPDDSSFWQRESLLLDLAEMILNERLEILLLKPDTPLTSAETSSGYFLQQIKYADISGQCKPDKWRGALSVLEQELRKALQFGFLSSELDRAKKDYLARLQQDIQESGTQESKKLAHNIMSSLTNRRVLQSPEQRSALLIPMVDAASPEKVYQAFLSSWSAPHRLILVTGNADLSSQNKAPEKLLLDAFHESSMVAVNPAAETQVLQFPYLEKPISKGHVLNRKQLVEGIEQVELDNGFQIYLKPTKFNENKVMIALSFGGGKASESAGRPGLAELTESVLNESGFGRMNRMELERALAGKLARIQLQVREDMFVVKGDANTIELPLLIQLLHTFVHDPGFHPEAFQVALKRYEQHYRSLENNVEGVMETHGRQFLAGGDSRFMLPDMNQMQQYSLAEIEAWFGRQLRQAPLELAVVGDFDTARVVNLAQQYFGDMPRRLRRDDWNKKTDIVFPAGEKASFTAQTAIPKSLVVVSYPTDDFWDIQRTRRLNILAEVISERLRMQIREKLGAAYSPFAYNRSYRSYPGFGLLQVFLTIDPGRVEEIVREVNTMIRRIVELGIEPDEFRRALDPTLTGIKDWRQDNRYWLNSVLLGAGRHPEQLTWCSSMEQDYAAIKSDDIVSLARKYLDVEKAALVTISPLPDN